MDTHRDLPNVHREGIHAALHYADGIETGSLSHEGAARLRQHAFLAMLSGYIGTDDPVASHAIRSLMELYR